LQREHDSERHDGEGDGCDEEEETVHGRILLRPRHWELAGG
jgi:hypothetical protein